MPDYFPDYKVYIWLDADLWLNDYESFKLYEQGALQDCIAITPNLTEHILIMQMLNGL